MESASRYIYMIGSVRGERSLWWTMSRESRKSRSKRSKGWSTLGAVLVSNPSGSTGTGMMLTDMEREQEQEPLLDELGNRIPDVYPLIHAIRAVRNFLSISSYFIDTCLPTGRDGNRPIAYSDL
jgi:hypothetical protein